MDTKPYHAELRALLSIRNFSKTMDKHYEQMLQIEKNLDEMNKDTSAIIAAHCSVDSQKKWKYNLKELQDSVFAINQVLKSLKEKVAKLDRSDSSELWKQFDAQIAKLKENYKTSEKLGLEILPESEHEHWKNDICNFEDAILPLIISHADACKVELKIIEKYTPAELHKITKIILDHIPEDFTIEEADKYEEDYLRAVEEFKKEFSHEKNLWDKFLDILAGGTHQPPSERVMLERWIEGEKQDL